MKAKLFPSKFWAFIFILVAGSGCQKNTLKIDVPQQQNSTRQKSVLTDPFAKEGELITYHMKDGGDMTVKKVGDQYFLGGDILLTAKQLAAIQASSTPDNKVAEQAVKPNSTFVSNTTLLWPNATVYYVINDPINQATITDAINTWNNSTVVHFVPRTNQANYVQFIPSVYGVNYSTVGMSGTAQDIGLVDFTVKGSIMHEMGHTVGLFHEQSRADRTSYITVTSNINNDWASQYQVYSGLTGFQIGPFDFGSVMLYPSRNPDAANPGDNRPQMTKLDGTEFPAQRNGLSTGDISGIAYMYNKLFLRLRMVNVPVTPVTDVYKTVKNIYIDFFEDANCTIPKTLTNDVQVNITESVLTWYTYAPHPVNTFTTYSRNLAAGTHTYTLRSNYTVSLLDDRDDGVNHKSFRINLYMSGWVGYVIVTPNVSQ